MSSNDDTLDLPLSQYVTNSNHRYGDVQHSSIRHCDAAMSVRYRAENLEQSLEQLPPTKLLNDEQVLDKTAIGQGLEINSADEWRLQNKHVTHLSVRLLLAQPSVRKEPSRQHPICKDVDAVLLAKIHQARGERSPVQQGVLDLEEV